MGMTAIHPLVVRVTHWLNAFAMVCMIMSGWLIYNANPLFGFSFPRWATLGGWLGGAIAWHLAAMWLLVLNGAVYIIWGLISGHFRRRFLPIRGRALLRDTRD
jgi:thiosulfate reductase cytochrome b subunit